MENAGFRHHVKNSGCYETLGNITSCLHRAHRAWAICYNPILNLRTKPKLVNNYKSRQQIGTMGSSQESFLHKGKSE